MVCILGLAVSGGALVLLVPPLFGPDGGVSSWVFVALSCLALALAIGALLSKPHVPASGGGP